MSDFESFLLQVLIQLAVIIAAARTGAWLLSRLGQPQVVGEIVAGLMLGPSVLGRVAPGLSETLFPDEAAVVFRVLSELGLVLLMFLIGLEFDFSHLRKVGRAAMGVASAGIALPFGLGLGLAMWMHPLVAADVNPTGFSLIIAVALSITAIPILGRIMIELNLHRTQLGTLIISAAAIDDALGWILLAGVSAMIHGGFQVFAIVQMLFLTMTFVGGCWLIGRRVLSRTAEIWFRRVNGDLSLTGLSAVLVMVFLSAAVTNWIGIFSLFGPFVLGAVLSDQHSFCEAVTRRLREIVYALFLPIFFCYSGLRTNVGLLQSSQDWWLCCLILAAAIIGKMGGCGLAARASGLSWRQSGCVAVMMSTRALMGLIAINVGREMEVIPENVFCRLVLMAIVTTFLTTPVLRRLLRGCEADVAVGEIDGNSTRPGIDL